MSEYEKNLIIDVTQGYINYLGNVLYFFFVILTKQQVQALCNLLYFLIEDYTDVKQIKFMGDDIILIVEPVKGEIENRSWRINPAGAVIPTVSFFYD